MKKIYLLLLFITTLGFAQGTNKSTLNVTAIPVGYYNTATGTGAILKTQLYNIIKAHNDNGYNGLWTTYSTSDRDHQYENDNTIMDMYSENPTGADPYTYTYNTDQCGSYSGEGSCYNREHIIPQSVFNSASPMVADAHFIPPTDGKVNGQRSNFPHGTVGTASWTSLNGGKLGSSSIAGYSGTVFEPINEFKGDIARMYFYFVTRYENTVAGYSYAAFSGNSYPAIDNAFLTMLMAWHNSDPVSAFEIARNDAIYARQNNRNPYIDHPEYVAAVWGGGGCAADVIPPTAPTVLTVGIITSSTIALSWTASTDNIGVTNYDIFVNGVKYASSGGATSITLNGLNPATTYTIYIVAKDCQGNTSVASTTVTPTTSAGGSCAGSIDENFENIGTASSSYTTYSWTNPTTTISWTATDARNDQTINTKAITIKNGSLTSGNQITNGIGDLTVTTQLKFGTIAGTFTVKANGIAVGTIPYSTTLSTTTIPVNVSGAVILSIDTNSVTGGRVGFDDLSWNCYSGTLSSASFDETSFKIYPNPSNGNFKIDFEDSGNYSVEIFSLIGQKVFEEKETNKSNITISHLQIGMYLVKVTKDNKSIVKKIVIN